MNFDEYNRPLFTPWPKIPRLSREIIISEKIDGTNASIYIGEDRTFLVGSRTRWITPENDNYGFAAWARDNKEELLLLGPGHHFGEWWGKGIQRGYGLNERRFSLFNTRRWENNTGIGNNLPPMAVNIEIGFAVGCCSVVPVLYRGEFGTPMVNQILLELRSLGSFAAPGFMDPEGIIIYHVAGGHYYKKTIKDDESPKSIEWKGRLVITSAGPSENLACIPGLPDPFQVLGGDKLADNPENQ